MNNCCNRSVSVWNDSALKVDLNDTIHLNTVRIVDKLFCVYAYHLTFCT